MAKRACAIVGAGEGLGQSLAAAFAGAGFDVGLVSRSEEGSAAAAEAARKANPKAKVAFFAGDAGKPATIEAALAEAGAALGGIDVLIYNVRGGFWPKPPLEIGYD
ncbi:MAG: SDR family NAD(P)-dependent oxidoreductase, partial [Candidatus Binatia bacterium]